MVQVTVPFLAFKAHFISQWDMSLAKADHTHVFVNKQIRKIQRDCGKDAFKIKWHSLIPIRLIYVLI